MARKQSHLFLYRTQGGRDNRTENTKTRVVGSVEIPHRRNQKRTPEKRSSRNWAYLFPSVKHFGFESHNFLLRHSSLPRDLGVLSVKSMRPVPLAPERLHGFAGPSRQSDGGVGCESRLRCNFLKVYIAPVSVSLLLLLLMTFVFVVVAFVFAIVVGFPS